MNFSINDAASLLIQIDPEDTSELNRLLEMVGTLANDSTYPESCKDMLLNAADRISKVIGSASDDPEQSLTEVGQFLEDVMNEIEESKKADPIPVKITADDSASEPGNQPEPENQPKPEKRLPNR